MNKANVDVMIIRQCLTQKNIQMYGLLTTIPLMITFVALLVKAVIIIRGKEVQKFNQSTRLVHLIIVAALILGTLPLFLGIINGIFFDLLPKDPYLPLILDRFTFIGGFLLGLFLMAVIVTISFIRHSFLMNISKPFATKFGILLLLLTLLSGCPIFVEACLFASGAINDQRYLKMVRIIAIVGSIFPVSFIIWTTLSIYKAMCNLAKTKKHNQNSKIFQKAYILIIVNFSFFLALYIFLALFMVSEYRSKEYLLYFNLAGACVGLSPPPLVDVYLIFRETFLEILSHRRKPKKLVIAAVANTIPTMPPTVKLENDTEIIMKK